MNTHLFVKRFSSVEMQMRAVGIGNEWEYVIKFICVVKRLDLLYDQVLVEVGGHFCYGRWSINDPFFLFSRRLLLWSDSGEDYGLPMMIHLFSLSNFSITPGRLLFIIWNNKSFLIKPPLILTSILLATCRAPLGRGKDKTVRDTSH